MKRFVIKYWLVFPGLLVASVLLFFVLILLIPFAALQGSPLVFLEAAIDLLILIALPVSWIVLLINKQWRKAIISFLVSFLVLAVFHLVYVWLYVAVREKIIVRMLIPDDEIESVIEGFKEPSSADMDTLVVEGVQPGIVAGNEASE